MIDIISKAFGIFLLAQTWLGMRGSSYFIGLRWYLLLSAISIAAIMRNAWGG